MLKKMMTSVVAAGIALACLAGPKDDGLDQINFPLNGHVVVDEFQWLDILAQVMAKHSNLSLVITGHTDALGPTAYNDKLSKRRAESVKAFLESRGVRSEQIEVQFKGESSPLVEGDDREARFQNRRVNLDLYQLKDGARNKLGYADLIALFMGNLVESGQKLVVAEGDHAGGTGNMAALGNGEAMKTLTEIKEGLEQIHDAIKKQGEMTRNLETRVEGLENRFGQQETMMQNLAGAVKLNDYSGLSFSLGVDDEDELTGSVRGHMFRPFNDQFALQAQGELNYFDTREEGQVDFALVYQTGHFKFAGATSYRYVHMDNFDSMSLAQGAFMVDYMFGVGKFGLYGTIPLADGDVIGSFTGFGYDGAFIGNIYTQEVYVEVPPTYGLDYAANFTEKFSVKMYAGFMDTASQNDLTAGLNLDFKVGDNSSIFLEAHQNETYVGGLDDNYSYRLGFSLGSWRQADYRLSESVTPVEIPKIHYELLTRTMRTGNTGPNANAGTSRTDVPAGTITLDGSASSDPEGDPLTYRWSQLNGPIVAIQNRDQAVASFVGELGQAYTFMLTVTDHGGLTSSDVVSISMEDVPVEIIPPSISFFTAIPDTIDQGEFTTLSWNTEHATTISIQGLGNVNESGSLVLAPDQTTVYVLTASSENGTASETLTVTVIPPEPPPEEEPPNTLPIADAGLDVFRPVAGAIMLDGSRSFDPDGDTLIYQWIQVSGKTVAMSGADTATPTITVELGHFYKFRLIIHDGRGGYDTDDVLVSTGF